MVFHEASAKVESSIATRAQTAMVTNRFQLRFRDKEPRALAGRFCRTVLSCFEILGCDIWGLFGFAE